MLDTFKITDVKKLSDNPFHLMDDEWMLISAGKKDHFNIMTASWGAYGILWNRPVAICFVRPQRYTYQFMETNDWFTLTFFGEQYRKMLNYCGSKSGRQVNKVKETGLTPIETPHGNVIFAEARLAMECRKIYHEDFHPDNFNLPGIPDEFYPSKEFHRMFIGEIMNCWKNK